MKELTQPGRPLSLSLSLSQMPRDLTPPTYYSSFWYILPPKAILTLTLLLLRKPNKQMTEKKRELQRDGQKSQWTSNPSFNSFLWLVVGPFFFLLFFYSARVLCRDDHYNWWAKHGSNKYGTCTLCQWSS